jgi:hypothetical protein
MRGTCIYCRFDRELHARAEGSHRGVSLQLDARFEDRRLSVNGFAGCIRSDASGRVTTIVLDRLNANAERILRAQDHLRSARAGEHS